MAPEGMAKLASYNISYIWKATSKSSCPKGIVVLLQSCGFTGHEWWKHAGPLPGLRTELAMPAESRIALRLLQNGYTVMSMAAYANRNKNKCWHEDDLPVLAAAMNAVRSSHNTSLLIPFFALGVYKAGFYLGLNALTLARKHGIRLSGLLVMNSGIWHEDYRKQVFPPTMFIDMNRNAQVTLHNYQTMLDMRKHQLNAVQWSSDPWPITESYFDEHGVLSQNSSIALHRAMAADGKYLWPGSGTLLIDPVSNRYLKDFRQLVSQALPAYLKKDSMKGLHSPLLQAMGKAYNFRETNDEFADQVQNHLSI